MTTRLSPLAGCLLLATSGCYVDASSGYDEPYDEGALLIDWTIAGTRSPYECRRSAASTLAVVIETSRGRFVDEFAADCEAFATSIVLPPGSYVATVLLLDRAGYDRTTAISTAFRVYAGYDTELPVDFPPSSFY